MRAPSTPVRVRYRLGTPHESVSVRSRRYDPSSSRLSVKLFVPTWFGFSPIAGKVPSGLVGLHAFTTRSTDTFTRGELSVRMRFTLRILPPFAPCSNDVNW